MTLPTTLSAFPAEVSAFDRALDTPLGIRIPCDTFTAARLLANRLTHARTLDRRDKARTLEPSHPMFGHSDWDSLYISLRQVSNRVYVYILHREETIPDIEDLTPDMLAAPKARPQGKPPESAAPPPISTFIRSLRR